MRAGDEHSLSRRAYRGAVWSSLATVIMLPVNFLGSLLVARILGPADLGEFVALTVFLTLSGPILDFGFSAALPQWAGRAVATGDESLVEELFRKALGFYLLLQLPLTLLGAAVLLRNSPNSYLLTFALLLLIGAGLSSTSHWLAAHNILAVGAKRSIAAGVLGNVVLVAVAAVGGEPEQMWLSRAAVQLLPALAVLFVLGRPALQILFRPRLPRHMPPGFWALARPLWVTTMLGALLATRTEVFLLRGNGFAVAAGVFAVGYGLAAQIMGLISGVHASFGAALVSTGHDPELLARGIERGRRLFDVLASLIMAAAGGAAFAIVPLYGEEYASAVGVFVAVLVASSFQHSLTVYGAAVLVRRESRPLLSAQALALALDLGVAAALIPRLGLAGATAGAVLGMIAINGYFLARAERAACLRQILCSAWATGVVSMAMALALGHSVGGGWPGALTASGVGVIAQVLLLLLLHRPALVAMLEWLAPLLPQQVVSAVNRVIRSNAASRLDQGGRSS